MRQTTARVEVRVAKLVDLGEQGKTLGVLGEADPANR